MGREPVHSSFRDLLQIRPSHTKRRDSKRITPRTDLKEVPRKPEEEKEVSINISLRTEF